MKFRYSYPECNAKVKLSENGAEILDYFALTINAQKYALYLS